MKKWITAVSLACSSLVYADSSAIVRNTLINGTSHGINYEFTDPTGAVYRGALTSGQMRTIYVNDLAVKLYGTYTLSTNECQWSWFTWTCKSKFKTAFIQRNEDVLWTNNGKEITVTETILPYMMEK